MNKQNVLVFPAGTEIANEVLNSLKNNKYFNVHCASSELKSFANYKTSVVDFLPYVDNVDFKKNLEELIVQKKIDFIIPAHDDVSYFLSTIENDISAKVIGHSYYVNDIVRFKDKTYDFFKDCLPLANVYYSVPISTDFPVFVKPKRGQGSLNAVKINSIEEYQNFFKNHDIEDFVVLEYLSGEEFTIDCFSHDGNVLYCGARSREKTSRGISILSTLVEDASSNAEFFDFANVICNKLCLSGAWFFQMKYDSKNMLKLLEVGPRVSGTMMLNRARGVNFIELSLFQKMGHDIDVVFNDIKASLARSLVPIYKHDISYDNLYVDFDDTLFIDEKTINTDVIKLIFIVKNRGGGVFLITKNVKNNLASTLKNYGISNIFDDIYHLRKDQRKVDFMLPSSLLVDDSYSERKEALLNGFYAYGIDCLDVLY